MFQFMVRKGQLLEGPCMQGLDKLQKSIKIKVSKLPAAARFFVSIPSTIARSSLIALAPLVLLIDRVAKPILASFNKYVPAEKKFRKCVLMLPKLIATVPVALLTATVIAIAIPILFVPMVIARMVGSTKL